ncbi:14312_t:CDS:2, partial [Funneliformis caledonium]
LDITTTESHYPRIEVDLLNLVNVFEKGVMSEVISYDFFIRHQQGLLQQLNNGFDDGDHQDAKIRPNPNRVLTQP